MPHKPFAHDLQARDIYPETFIFLWEEFLTTKFGLWIDTRSSTDNTLHGSGRAVEKVAYYFKLKKLLKPVMVTLQVTCLDLKM